MSRPAIAACAFISGACVGFGIAAFLTLREEPPVAVLPESGTVLRSLHLRIDNVDKLSRSRGDRYRLFNCREVAR